MAKRKFNPEHPGAVLAEEFLKRLENGQDRLAQRKDGKTAYEIAKEMGVVGIDGDPRRNVAKQHSKYVKTALRGRRSA